MNKYSFNFYIEFVVSIKKIKRVIELKNQEVY